MATYYVTTTGSTGTGTIGDPWSISYSFSNAIAGDVVYIKAGDYVVDATLTPNSGTSGNPIKFIGYKTTVGDIVSTNRPTVTYANFLANSNELDPTEMPLIRRTSVQLATDSNRRGIELGSKSYIEIENLQFQWQERAINGFQHGAGIKVKNLAIAWVGNYNPVDTWTSGGLTYDPPLPAEASGGESTNQVGKGVDLSGAIGAWIENVFVVNAGHSAIVVGTITGYPQTQNATIKGCVVYADSQINPTDYYIEGYNTQYTLVEDCEVYRIKGLVHQGHGIDFKRGSNNTARNCYVENTWLEVNLVSNNNLFENITVKGMQNYSPNRRSGGVKIYAGSHTNTFKNIKFIDADGILFADVWDESSLPSNAGYNNIFINCLFHNSQYNAYRGSQAPIVFEANTALENYGGYNYNSTPCYNNKFYNCTFDTAPALFNAHRPNYGNELINCNVTNITAVNDSHAWGDALDATFTNTNFESSGIPGGYTNLGLTSGYTNAAIDDFSLLETSGLIGQGITTSYTYDINNNVRTPPFDIGAYQYNSTPDIPLIDIKFTNITIGSNKISTFYIGETKINLD